MRVDSSNHLYRSVGLAAVLALAGCGGSDGGSNGPIAVVPTTPAPTPTPTPTPTTTTAFTTPSVAREIDSGGGRRVSDALLDNGARVLLTEPDTTSAAVIENATFNGNETYEVTQPNTPGSYLQRFPSSSFIGRGSNSFAGSGSERLVPQLTFQNGGTAILVLPQLEETRKTAATAASGGNVTDHVRLADVRIFGPTGVANGRGLQLFGTEANAGILRTSGTATFVGEAFGDAFLSGVSQDCIGDAVVTVDYARRTVTGQITISQYLGTAPPKATLTIEFTADIVASSIVSRSLTIRGDNIIETGTLRGNFYGRDADELGLVFSASGAAGNFIGALVAGKE